jgi:hypothetical protein
MPESPAERYVQLGLQLDRHVEGMVDSYFGPPDLKAAVDAEPIAEPPQLVADAGALLGELEEGWLRDQVIGLRTFAGVLAGESLSYADEVERCYGVRPTYTDEAVFEAAHERLEELLPGDGPLAERHRQWRDSLLVPTEKIEAAMAGVIEEARRWTSDSLDLPPGEGVELEIVRDKPRWAFCEYLGDLRSRIWVNADLPMGSFELLRLTMHKTYPGHHVERACKEDALVRGRGLLEEAIVMVPTAQSLVAEGIAVLAPELVFDTESAPRLVAVLRAAGIELALERARAVDEARKPCRWVEINAALMLHERGATEADTQSYVERWEMLSPEHASHLVRFLQEPTSRSYILTYAAGYDLCRSYVAGDLGRFRRLLTEQVRVRDLLTA